MRLDVCCSDHMCECREAIGKPKVSHPRAFLPLMPSSVVVSFRFFLQGGMNGIKGYLALCRCCTSHNLHRSIAVEVKSVATDAGRAKFVHLLRYSLATHC